MGKAGLQWGPFNMIAARKEVERVKIKPVYRHKWTEDDDEEEEATEGCQADKLNETLRLTSAPAKFNSVRFCVIHLLWVSEYSESKSLLRSDLNRNREVFKIEESQIGGSRSCETLQKKLVKKIWVTYFVTRMFITKSQRSGLTNKKSWGDGRLWIITEGLRL